MLGTCWWTCSNSIAQGLLGLQNLVFNQQDSMQPTSISTKICILDWNKHEYRVIVNPGLGSAVQWGGFEFNPLLQLSCTNAMVTWCSFARPTTAVWCCSGYPNYLQQQLKMMEPMRLMTGSNQLLYVCFLSHLTYAYCLDSFGNREEEHITRIRLAQLFLKSSTCSVAPLAGGVIVTSTPWHLTCETHCPYAWYRVFFWEHPPAPNDK